MDGRNKQVSLCRSTLGDLTGAVLARGVEPVMGIKQDEIKVLPTWLTLCLNGQQSKWGQIMPGV